MRKLAKASEIAEKMRNKYQDPAIGNWPWQRDQHSGDWRTKDWRVTEHLCAVQCLPGDCPRDSAGLSRHSSDFPGVLVSKGKKGWHWWAR